VGRSPLANSFLDKNELKKEPFYPLHAYVCKACYLVQLEEIESPKKNIKTIHIFHPIQAHGSNIAKIM
jgi:hypothetical protein